MVVGRRWHVRRAARPSQRGQASRPNAAGTSRLTPWGDDLLASDAIPLPDYPRPQLVRDSYLNLNGRWDYAITTTDQPPTSWDGQILVPFSPETALSGVGRRVLPDDHLWYRRQISLPKGFQGGRLLVHFGAVDQDCEVYIGDDQVGEHRGGYLPFTVDLTSTVNDARTFELRVHVRDITNTGYRSTGKQSLHPGGIWYSPHSGIWQTVWLESVPAIYVTGLTLRPLPDHTGLELVVRTSAPCQVQAEVGAPYPGEGQSLPGAPLTSARLRSVSSSRGDYLARLRLTIPEPHPWSPEDPYLYWLRIRAGDDTVTSYAAIRTVGLQPDAHGRPVIALNGRPYLQAGVLDQGYWPDSGVTPPADDAMVTDIQAMRAAGFTMLRKHVKIEPLRWYYHCDRLGMLVWQDMVNGGRTPGRRVSTSKRLTRLPLPDRWYRLFGRQDAPGRTEFRSELAATVALLANSPSVVAWVLFNESWGQFDAALLTRLVRRLDPTRLIDHASGWYDQGAGDIRSLHVYGRPIQASPQWGEDGRSVVLTEYGGYSLRMPGQGTEFPEYGYRRASSSAELTEAYRRLHREELLPAVRAGLAGYVYTQLADVEGEVNGLRTADRRYAKIGPDVLARLNTELRRVFNEQQHPAP